MTVISGSATWTYEPDHDGAWYVDLTERSPPPYLRQIHVEAIIDVDADGRAAGIEIIDPRMPPPPERRRS